MYHSRWGEDEGGGGGGNRYSDRLKNGIDFRNMNVEERKRMAKNRQAQFETKLFLENLRRNMSKGGEIITLMKERTDMRTNETSITQMEVANILKSAGVKVEEVEGITFNPYRTGQVEIQFKKGVKVDTGKMEDEISKNEMKIEIAPYDHIEEVIMIKGIPLSEDLEGLRGKIEETIRPFVKQVKRIEACKYRDGGDFFKNKLNGMWRVVIEPKQGCHVPNFIVVDKDAKVQGQVQYKKKYEFRPEMCSDCYEEDHLRGNIDCKGVVTWEEYCERFDKRWLEETAKKGEQCERRVSRNNRELEDKLKKIELENKELRDRVSKKIAPETVAAMETEMKELRDKVSKKIAPETVAEMETEIKELNEKMKKFGAEKEKWEKESQELETEKEEKDAKLKEQYKCLQNWNEELRKLKDEDEKKHAKIIKQQQEIETLKVSLEKKETLKRVNSVEIGRDGKSVKMTSGVVQYQWSKPKKPPKKDKNIWIEVDKKPVEAKVDRIDGMKFTVTESARPNKQWIIHHATDNWAEEKPIEKFDSSGSFNGFPEELGLMETENNMSKVRSILKGTK